MSIKRRILFFMFFVSGWCGLLYQVVWVRMAFAAFGIITPVLSVVISVFMLGLFAGSWLGGRWIGPLTAKTGISPITVYGVSELCIGLGAFIVPKLFSLGAAFLLPLGNMDSLRYLLLSGAVISISILPWCVCMGATFPLMMAFVKEAEPSQGFHETSFSFLYLANVLGAMCGTALTALVLVEIYGFSHTLRIAAFFNFLIAMFSFRLGRGFRRPVEPQVPTATQMSKPVGAARPATTSCIDDDPTWTSPPLIGVILFTTGLISMAMEVVWTRAFTPVLSTTIYAFAALLTTYLFATWVGSCFYRRHLRKGHAWTTAKLLACLAVFSFLPIALNDPRLSTSRLVVLLSIIPICAALGYLTPKLIDQYSSGSPRSAGKGYALNILGCIIGPLLAGYGLLPWLGVRFSMVLLATPFLLFYARHLMSNREAKHAGLGVLSLALLLTSVFVNVTYEDGAFSRSAVVRRDYAATVISHGKGMEKGLLVNGVGITSLTPITKLMAHLPLAFRSTRPQSALVICFGMGTTFRSLMSWDIEVTAVELVPSVKDAFGYYFEDAPTLLRNPKGRIIIDDGRRFLNRTAQKFDVITIDPPPPVEAAGSSLLYSQEFYELVKQHLTSNGILQQWFPGGEEKILFAVINSLTKVFPYVKMYRSIEGWGVHFIAATQPFQTPSSDEMIARMPAAARADLMEWFPKYDLGRVVNAALSQQIGFDKSVLQETGILISDDSPFNEYFFLSWQWDQFTDSYHYVN